MILTLNPVNPVNPVHSNHQNGSFMPGMFNPAVRPAIFSSVVFSTLRTASFMAAAIRSSSTSLSSCNRVGSICTRLTSWRQVMVTLTMPPPLLPVTSMVASCSWALRRLSCIACACFMIFPNPPFMSSSSLSDLGPNRSRVDPGAEFFLQRAHVGVLDNSLHRRLLALVLQAALFLRRSFHGRSAEIYLQAQR